MRAAKRRGAKVAKTAKSGVAPSSQPDATILQRPVRNPAVIWLSLVLTVLVLLAFGNIITHEFDIRDDEMTIQLNPHFNPPTLSSIAYYWSNAQYGLYMPVTQTVWGALAWIGRTSDGDAGATGAGGATTSLVINPYIFHLASVWLHAGATLLVFSILRRILGQSRLAPAAIGAALFAVHPVQVEAVAWASGMKDLLAGMFALLAIDQYLRGTRDSDPTLGAPPVNARMHFMIATAAFVLAMLSKPIAVVTPLLVITIERIVLSRPWRRVLGGPVLAWIPLALPVAAIARLAQPGTGVPTTPPWTRPFIAGDALAFYLMKLIAPVRLAIDYGWRPTWMIQQPWFYVAWLAPAAVVIALWMTRRRAPALAGAGLIFLIAVFPVLGLMPFLYQYFSTVTDHYLYLAMLGPALALAWAMTKWRAAYVRGICVLLLGVLTVRTMIEAGYWENSKTLLDRTLHLNQRSFAAWNNAGLLLQREDRVFDSEKYFRESIAIMPIYSTPHGNLAAALIRQSQFEKGRATRQAAVEKDPVKRQAILDQSSAKQDALVKEGIAEIEEVIRLYEAMPPTLRGDLAETHKVLGGYLLAQGDYLNAIRHLEASLLLKYDPLIDQDLKLALQKQAALKTTMPTTQP